MNHKYNIGDIIIDKITEMHVLIEGVEFLPYPHYCVLILDSSNRWVWGLEQIDADLSFDRLA